MRRPVEAWIGLGSNLDDPLQQLARALAGLAALPGTTLVAQSPFYRSRPVGPQDQPDFVNGVALLETRLSAEALLDELQALEQAHGRTRRQRWGPRTLDLDLLLFGDEIIVNARLTVPHPRLQERDFVLRPLLDIRPGLALPDGRAAARLLEECTGNELARLEPRDSAGLATPPSQH